MWFRICAALFLAALAAPLPAQATPIDLDALGLLDDDEDLLDGGDLVRGGTRTDEAKKDELEFDFEEPDEFDDLEDFDLPEDDPPDDIVPLGDFEDDEPFEFDAPPPKPEPAATPASPGRITLEVAGKEPLSDNYPLSVVAVDRDSVVVELPVLVARSRVGVDKGFLVYGEVFVGATRVAEVRQMVEPASLAEFGPTFVFLKVLAPVVESQGEIKVVVQKADLDGTGRSELFTRVTPYRL